MIRASTGDTKLIEQFLRVQRYRHTATAKNYAGLLREFNGFVAKHGCGATPTESIVRDWLKERSLKWAAHILYHRACLVERNLNLLEGQGVIAANPFAELHRLYGPRTTPIVGALVSKDSDTELQPPRANMT
jgi:integrase/recombinase XerD